MVSSIRPTVRPIRYTLMILFLITGLLLLAGALLPYNVVSALLNRLAADGSFDSFTPNLHRSLVPLLFLAGGLFSLLGIAPIAFPGLSHRAGLRIDSAWTVFRSDSKAFLQTLRRVLPTGWQAGALAFITLVGIFTRLVFILRPMQHDEAYTVMAFANTPLYNLLSDYHLPNNHIFHTLLVHFSIKIFGLASWAVRLPALLAGVLTIPVGYVFTRRIYGQPAALSAAAALAVFPVLLEYATNARGYTLLALFSLLGLTLALYLKDHFNRLGWLLLVFFMALGMWTVPIMLYPAGLIWLWLLGSSLLGDSQDRPWVMFRRLLTAGLALILLTWIFYLPVFLRSGSDYLLNNPFIAPLTWPEFADTFPVRMVEIWRDWTSALPGWLTGFIVAGFALSILLHWQISAERLPLQLTAVAWLSAEMLAARPNPYTRYFIFLLPLILVWAVAGWLGFVQRLIRPPVKILRWLSPSLAIAILAGGLLSVLPHLGNLRGDPGEVELAAIRVIAEVLPGDVVIAAAPMDAPLWYYLGLHQLPRSAYFHPEETKDIQRAFVMVTLSENQTVVSVLAEARAPETLDASSPTWLISSGNNRLALISAKNP